MKVIFQISFWRRHLKIPSLISKNALSFSYYTDTAIGWYESFICASFIHASNLEKWSKPLYFKTPVEGFQILNNCLLNWVKNESHFSTSVSFDSWSIAANLFIIFMISEGMSLVTPDVKESDFRSSYSSNMSIGEVVLRIHLI